MRTSIQRDIYAVKTALLRFRCYVFLFSVSPAVQFKKRDTWSLKRMDLGFAIVYLFKYVEHDEHTHQR